MFQPSNAFGCMSPWPGSSRRSGGGWWFLRLDAGLAAPSPAGGIRLDRQPSARIPYRRVALRRSGPAGRPLRRPRVFDHTEVRLQDFIGRDAGFTYAYDFGDGWEHQIRIEEWLALGPAPRHALCLEGGQARPSEAVGGPRGYADFLGIIRDHGARGPSLHAAMGGWAFRSGMVRSRPDQQGSAQCAARERVAPIVSAEAEGAEGLAARISPTPDRRITWSG